MLKIVRNKPIEDHPVSPVLILWWTLIVLAALTLLGLSCMNPYFYAPHQVIGLSVEQVERMYGPPDTEGRWHGHYGNFDRMYFLCNMGLIARYLVVKLDAENKVVDAKLVDLGF